MSAPAWRSRGDPDEFLARHYRMHAGEERRRRIERWCWRIAWAVAMGATIYIFWRGTL